MPKYHMIFDTTAGPVPFNVDVDDDELLDDVLDEILFDLRERGSILKDDGDGDLQVVWNGKSLDFGQPLPVQGVSPNDRLRVSIRPDIG